MILVSVILSIAWKLNRNKPVSMKRSYVRLLPVIFDVIKTVLNNHCRSCRFYNKSLVVLVY